ncbi:MAG: pilin [Dokdonella sp.]|uniref:pilin n=1 Tax=Dokdonella sp. TaxID=2291710 RepID=UPI0032656D50
MRNDVLVVAGGLIAVVAGVLLYQGMMQRQDQKQLLSEMRLQSESTRRELDRLSAEQSAIRTTVTQTHDAVAAVTDPSNIAMRNDFTSVAAMRTAIAEYYATTLKLPSNNQEAGLAAPDQYHGTALQSASVMPDGHIELLFGAVPGHAGGHIRLVPDLSGSDAMGMRWHCETDDFASIAQTLPGCEYKGVHPTDAAQPAIHAAATEG